MKPPLPLSELGRRPIYVTDDAHYAEWFAALAERLLNACNLVVAGDCYRFAELEMYFSGGPHPDLFAHRDPLQLEDGRLYFHRTCGEYRGGSFKGLDLTFGNLTAHFGVLVRTIVAPDGTLVVGPSLTVDHLLARTQAAGVAVLDGVINGRSIWDTTSPVHLVEANAPRTAPVYHSSRVGLSLKKAKGQPDAPRFIGRPYRFLTEPKGISKGKPHLVLALHCAGHAPDTIFAITGVPRKTISRYIADFTAGRHAPNFDAYIGKELGTAELCQLLGTWAAKYETTPADST